MNQGYIDFLNERKSYYQIQISALQSQKLSADEQIVQSENAIAGYNAQKDQADLDIVRFYDYITKVEDIIDILSNQN